MNKELMEKNGLISISKAADALGCSASTVNRWVQAGHVKGERVATYWYIDVGSFLHHIKSSTTQKDVAEKLGPVGETALIALHMPMQEGDADVVENTQSNNGC